MTKKNLPKADTLEKMVKGYFEICFIGENGEITERYADYNLITLSAYKQLLAVIAGDKNNTTLATLILGTDGAKPDGTPKGEAEGFNINLQDVFSIQNSKPYYKVTWEKQGGADDKVVQNVEATMGNVVGVNDGASPIEVNLYFDRAVNRVFFNVYLPQDRGNLVTNGSTAYSEAGLYFENNKIFAAKMFAPQSKTQNKGIRITWSFKTIGDSADGVEFRINTKNHNAQEVTLPFDTNLLPIIVDWGDGTDEVTIEANQGGVNLPTYKHTYATKGEFSVRVVGQKIPNFNFTGDAEPMKKMLTHIDMFNSQFQNDNFDNMFEDCVNLVSIPYSLFRRNIDAENFNSTFKGCVSLMDLPRNLLEVQPRIVSAVSMFEGCSNLVAYPDIFSSDVLDDLKLNPAKIKNIFKGTKPALQVEFTPNLNRFIAPFANNNNHLVIDWGDDKEPTLIKAFEGSKNDGYRHVFDDTTQNRSVQIYSLSNPIFDWSGDSEIEKTHLIKIFKCNAPFGSKGQKSLASMLSNAVNLVSVPANMFNYNTELENVTSLFENCVALTGNVSFITNDKIKNFSKVCWKCQSLTLTDNMINSDCVREDTIFFGAFYRTQFTGNYAGVAPKIWGDTWSGTKEDELAFGGEGNKGLQNYDEIPNILKMTNMVLKIVVPKNKLAVDLKLHPKRMVDWGDGSSSNGGAHQYFAAGEYEVRIYTAGDLSEWNMVGSDLPKVLKEVVRIGDVRLPTNHTFENCYMLESVPSDMFSAYTNATSFNYTFAGCVKLTTQLDFTANQQVTTFIRTFDECRSLTQLPIGFLKDGVTHYDFAFRNCDGLEDITSVSGELNILPASTVSIQGMFYECSNLKKIDALFFNIDNRDTLVDYSYAFFMCKNLLWDIDEATPRALFQEYQDWESSLSRNFDYFLYLSRGLENTNTFKAPQIYKILLEDQFGSKIHAGQWEAGVNMRIKSAINVFSPQGAITNLAEYKAVDNENWLLERFEHTTTSSIEKILKSFKFVADR